jgi:hypothetical protein
VEDDDTAIGPTPVAGRSAPRAVGRQVGPVARPVGW